MSRNLDMDKIAKGLGGKRRGKVKVSGGYFGAMQLAGEVARRFRTPAGGGRATDPRWTEKRLVPFAPETLEQLDKVAEKLKTSRLQAAGLILEQALARIRMAALAKEAPDKSLPTAREHLVERDVRAESGHIATRWWVPVPDEPEDKVA